MEQLTSFVSIAFILTTLSTVALLFLSLSKLDTKTRAPKLIIFGVLFWMAVTSIFALTGFLFDTYAFPPRFPIIPLPALLFIALLFIFFRNELIERLPLKILTLLHVVRIPVEIILLLLYKNGQIPKAMTFEGWNFDIIAGITAPIIFWIAFRGGKINRALLITWNSISLLLVTNIVLIAIFSLATPFQQFGLDQPNKAVLYFPFIWLPGIVVPIVLFAHLASLWQLIRNPQTRS